MSIRVITYDEMQRDVAGVLNDVNSGGTVLLKEADKPVAAIISFDDYLVLQEALEDLHDIRIAEAALEEYRHHPSTAIPWDEAKSILRAEGLLDEE
jgi:prevent-host-death family protein